MSSTITSYPNRRRAPPVTLFVNRYAPLPSFSGYTCPNRVAVDMANFAPPAYPAGNIAIASSSVSAVSAVTLLLFVAFHEMPDRMPVGCPLPVPLTIAAPMASAMALRSSSVTYPSKARVSMRFTAADMDSTLISSRPVKVTAVAVTSLRSTAAPSVCQLAASVGVPTGTDRLDGTLNRRISLNSPFTPRACFTISFRVCVGITAALLDSVLKLSARFSACAAS